MPQRKILIDSCSYLRLAETIHPLLGVAFGKDNCCLYVIKDFQNEYDKQPRLQTKFPTMNEERYRNNRKKRINLSKKQKMQLSTTIDAFDNFAYDEELTPSLVDLTALARAYLLGIELVTDDDDLLVVGREFEVNVMNTLELLKLMFSKVMAVCEYIEYIPDRPKHFVADKKRLFGI